MGVFANVLEMMQRYRQGRAERAALAMLVARKDRRLLRDAGLDLVEAGKPQCAPLPRAKERRWTAPLIRLPPPSPRKQGEGDGALASSGNMRNAKGNVLGPLPSPRLRGDDGRRAG